MNVNSYNEDISDDYSVFDIIIDIQEIRNIGGDSDMPQGLINFHLDYHQDDITLGCDGGEKDVSIKDGKLVTADNEKAFHLVMVRGGRFLSLYVTFIMMG